ncbi:hypothetical protein CGLAU_07815 [Corynebacterium glaucum]|uniref:Or membrane protein n=1 Tax=Corynebacterium glaucum TaxID=187491 RepID=A0A1Q2HXE7_9CORY|nr:hypothetical protein [Corynebacterium glaucum]AQQ15518.1 hypothetical protein CGLAU_07815 [Corynebacterium glaucum]
MRNLRKAAFAGATAVAVAFGSTSVALAQDAAASSNNTTNATVQGVEQPTNAEGSLSSRIGNSLESDQTAYGPALFGSSKGEAAGESETFEQQPVWAKILYGLSIFASVAAAFGLIVAPLYNFVVHGL